MPGQNLVVRDVRISVSITKAQESAFKELAKRRGLTLQEWMRYAMENEVSRQAAQTVRQQAGIPSVAGQMEALRQENRQIDDGIDNLGDFRREVNQKGNISE